MSYGRFAEVYDTLMQNAPYDEWVKFITYSLKQHGVQGRRVLDVGCGTGTVATRLASLKYEVTGVDLSEEMLAIAEERSAGKVRYFAQDMRELDGLGEFDCVSIVCDSLNYLSNLDEVRQTFESVSRHLSDEGLFVFDVHSVNKFQEQFNDQTYAENGDDVAFVWNALKGEEDNHVIHDLSFFAFDEKSGLYERFDEQHEQKTFSVEDYKQLIIDTGFTLVDVVGDFGQAEIDEADRILFVCRKV